MNTGILKSIRIISWLLVASFGTQQVVHAAPSPSSSPQSAIVRSAGSVLKKSSADISLPEIIRDPAKLDISLKHTVLKEIHQGTNGKLIIHIQDAHANLSGQQNLAGALDHILSTHEIPLVLVEGSDRDVSLGSIRELMNPKDLKIEAKKLLFEGVLSGEEYLNLTSHHPMRLIGIEDGGLYEKNLKLFRDLKDRRKKALPYLRKVQIAVDRIKNKLYPDEILRYEAMLMKSADTDYIEQIDYLTKIGKRKAIGPAQYPQIQKLMEIKREESRIDFGRLNEEQESVFKKISDKEALDDLRQDRAGHPDPALSQAAVIDKLIRLAESKHLNPDAYPNIRKYRQYLSRFRELKTHVVLDELDALEEKVYRACLSSEDLLTLRAIDRYTDYLAKAYKIKLSDDNYEHLNRYPELHEVASWQAYLNKKLTDLGYFEELIAYEETLEETRGIIREFYESVSERDERFMKGIERELTEDGEEAAFLIAGGYHTNHLTTLLREQGYSYIVLTPRVAYETDHDRYEQILMSALPQKGTAVHTLRKTGAASPGSAPLLNGFIKRSELARHILNLALNTAASRLAETNNIEVPAAHAARLARKDPEHMRWQVIDYIREYVPDSPDQPIEDRPPFDVDSFTMPAKRQKQKKTDTGQVKFGSYKRDGKSKVVSAYHKSLLPPEGQDEWEVTVTKRLWENPYYGMPPQWLVVITTPTGIVEHFRVDDEEGTLRHAPLTHDKYISQYAEHAKYADPVALTPPYGDLDRSPFPKEWGSYTKEPRMNRHKGEIVSATLSFGGYRDTSGKYHNVQATSTVFKDAKTIEVDQEFWEKPHAGMLPQWLIKVTYTTPQDKVKTKYYRFTGEGNGLESVDRSPIGYISAFSANGIYTDESILPFLEEAFDATTDDAGNGQVYLGHITTPGLDVTDTGKYKTISVLLTSIKTPNHPVRIKRTFYKGQWFIGVETNHPDYAFQTLYYRFAADGTLTREIDDPPEKAFTVHLAQREVRNTYRRAYKLTGAREMLLNAIRKGDWSGIVDEYTWGMENFPPFTQHIFVNQRVIYHLKRLGRLDVLRGRRIYRGAGPDIGHRAWLASGSLLLANGLPAVPEDAISLDILPEIQDASRRRFIEQGVPPELWPEWREGAMQDPVLAGDEPRAVYQESASSMFLRNERRHTEYVSMNDDMAMNGIGMVMTNSKPIPDEFKASLKKLGFKILVHERIRLSEEQKQGYRELVRQGLMSKADARKMMTIFRNNGEFLLIEKAAQVPSPLPKGLNFAFPETVPRVIVTRQEDVPGGDAGDSEKPPRVDTRPEQGATDLSALQGGAYDAISTMFAGDTEPISPKVLISQFRDEKEAKNIRTRSRRLLRQITTGLKRYGANAEGTSERLHAARYVRGRINFFESRLGSAGHLLRGPERTDLLSQLTTLAKSASGQIYLRQYPQAFKGLYAVLIGLDAARLAVATEVEEGLLREALRRMTEKFEKEEFDTMIVEADAILDLVTQYEFSEDDQVEIMKCFRPIVTRILLVENYPLLPTLAKAVVELVVNNRITSAHSNEELRNASHELMHVAVLFGLTEGLTYDSQVFDIVDAYVYFIENGSALVKPDGVTDLVEDNSMYGMVYTSVNILDSKRFMTSASASLNLFRLVQAAKKMDTSGDIKAVASDGIADFINHANMQLTDVRPHLRNTAPMVDALIALDAYLQSLVEVGVDDSQKVVDLVSRMSIDNLLSHNHTNRSAYQLLDQLAGMDYAEASHGLSIKQTLKPLVDEETVFRRFEEGLGQTEASGVLAIKRMKYWVSAHELTDAHHDRLIAILDRHDLRALVMDETSGQHVLRTVSAFTSRKSDHAGYQDRGYQAVIQEAVHQHYIDRRFDLHLEADAGAEDYSVGTELQSMKDEHPEIHRLLFNKQNARNLLTLTSELRLLYDFYSCLPPTTIDPLQYAIQNDHVFHISEDVYITAVPSGSFRRFVIFKMKSKGIVDYAVEIKTSGQDSGKRNVFADALKLAQRVEQSYPGATVRPIAHTSHRFGDMRWFGENYKWPIKLDLAVFGYRPMIRLDALSEPLKHTIESAGIKIEAESLIRQLLRHIAIVHSMGFYGQNPDMIGTDMHIGNIGMEFVDQNILLRQVADTESFVPLDMGWFRRNDQYKIDVEQMFAGFTERLQTAGVVDPSDDEFNRIERLMEMYYEEKTKLLDNVFPALRSELSEGNVDRDFIKILTNVFLEIFTYVEHEEVRKYELSQKEFDSLSSALTDESSDILFSFTTSENRITFDHLKLEIVLAAARLTEEPARTSGARMARLDEDLEGVKVGLREAMSRVPYRPHWWDHQAAFSQGMGIGEFLGNDAKLAHLVMSQRHLFEDISADTYYLRHTIGLYMNDKQGAWNEADTIEYRWRIGMWPFEWANMRDWQTEGRSIWTGNWQFDTDGNWGFPAFHLTFEGRVLDWERRVQLIQAIHEFVDHQYPDAPERRDAIVHNGASLRGYLLDTILSFYHIDGMFGHPQDRDEQHKSDMELLIKNQDGTIKELRRVYPRDGARMAWHDQTVGYVMNKEYVLTRLEEVRVKEAQINSELIRTGQPSLHYPVTEEGVQRYGEAIDGFNQMLHQPFSPEALYHFFLRTHMRLRGEVKPAAYGGEVDVEQFAETMRDEYGLRPYHLKTEFKRMFERRFENIFAEDPVKAAVKIYTTLVTRHHDFVDHHHRAAGFIMNLVLMKAGLSPLVVDMENIYEYTNATYQDLDVSIDNRRVERMVRDNVDQLASAEGFSVLSSGARLASKKTESPRIVILGSGGHVKQTGARRLSIYLKDSGINAELLDNSSNKFVDKFYDYYGDLDGTIDALLSKNPPFVGLSLLSHDLAHYVRLLDRLKRRDPAFIDNTVFILGGPAIINDPLYVLNLMRAVGLTNIIVSSGKGEGKLDKIVGMDTGEGFVDSVGKLPGILAQIDGESINTLNIDDDGKGLGYIPQAKYYDHLSGASGPESPMILPDNDEYASPADFIYLDLYCQAKCRFCSYSVSSFHDHVRSSRIRPEDSGVHK